MSSQTTLYGVSALQGFQLGKPGACAMHGSHAAGDYLRSIGVEVPVGILDGVGVPFSVGEDCEAEVGVRVLDCRFVDLLQGRVHYGFSYMDVNGLSFFGKYQKGAPVALSGVGLAYSYLSLIRPGAARRAARVLGPFPLVADVVAVLAAVGKFSVEISEMQQVGLEIPGFSGGRVRDLIRALQEQHGYGVGLTRVLWASWCLPALDVDECPPVLEVEVKFPVDHCYLALFDEEDREEVAQALGPRPGAGLVAHALKAVKDGGKLNPIVKYHVPEDLSPSQRGQAIGALYEFMGANPYVVVCGQDAEKGFCDRCGFSVKLEGHELRCRIPRVVDKRKHLVGDARHALDVKNALAVLCPVGAQYTEIAKRYMDAEMQKAYLQRVDPLALPRGASAHSWADEFESRYFGEFREKYLQWFEEDLGLGPIPRDDFALWEQASVPVHRVGVPGLVGRWLGIN